MGVLVYNGERFQRGKIWYLVFAVVFAGVFLLSVFNKNIIGAVLIFFLLGGYFYYSTVNNQVVRMTLSATHLTIGTKTYVWSLFTGYAVEIDPKTQELKNIVLITPKTHMIHSFDDTLDHIESFLAELDQYLPLLGEYHQSGFEKISRKMKL